MLSQRQALWLIPVELAIHNAEEALAFPRCLPSIRDRLPATLAAIASGIQVADLWAALAAVTIVPLAVVFWADRRPRSQAACWWALTVQAVTAINVLSHVLIAAFVLRGYGPGLVSALLVNAPVSAYILQRASREDWVPRGARHAIWPAAVLIHGPVLWGTLFLSSYLGRP
jgi:hypothetical protein